MRGPGAGELGERAGELGERDGELGEVEDIWHDQQEEEEDHSTLKPEAG